MPYIYKIENKLNGKIYIGKTLKTIQERWKEHCHDFKRERCEKRPLYSAMNKYGIENFFIEEIEQCEANILSEREKYWIEYYNSFKYGYNATTGGDGRSYLDYDLILSLWQEGKTAKEIAKILNHDEYSVRLALDVKGITSEKRQERSVTLRSKSVAKLDLNTSEIIEVFPSQMEAYRSLGKQQSGHICQVCNGKRKTAYGYKWKWLN